MNKSVIVLCSLLMVLSCKESPKTINSNEEESMNTGYEVLIIDINADDIDQNIDPNVAQDRQLFQNLNMANPSDFRTEWKRFHMKGVGVLDIPEAGEYFFRLTSSGKVGLSLNNVDLVIDYDKHEKNQKEGNRILPKGPAVFDFSYYACEFDPLLVLEWSKDGNTFEAIPDEYYKNTSVVDVEPWVDNDTSESTQEPNTLTDQEIEDGWKLLFDGTTTNGWHTYNRPGKIGSRWVAEDGALKFNGYDKYIKFKVAGKIFYHANVNKELQGGWDIVTDEAFENFELKLDWKISEYGNSGIFYTVQEIPEYDEGWKSSPEMQVLDDQGQKDGMIRSHRSADLYDLIPCTTRRTKAANNWNSSKIVKNRGKVEHWMNGEIVLSYDLNSDEWNNMIANSKFAPYSENFGSTGPGKIGLQDHDDTVWYRNIKIKSLD